MKSISIILISLCCLLCQAQEMCVCDTLKSIDTTFVRKEITRLSSSNKNSNVKLNSSSIDSMLVINVIDIHLDTLTNKLSFQEDKNKQLIFFYSTNHLSELTKEKGIEIFSETKNNEFRFRLNNISTRDFECVYFIPTLFPSIFTGFTDKNNLFYCKVKDSQQGFFIDSYFQVFLSFSEYLEYEFGSVNNYIDIYKNKLKLKGKLKENITEFFSTLSIKRKMRIRG